MVHQGEKIGRKFIPSALIRSGKLQGKINGRAEVKLAITIA